jgi:endogenous inhibitor of DNA gyrase (YacG/DUF329 family)
MTNKDKSAIISMRDKWYSYGKIADKLGLPQNTVKSVCHREAEKKKRCRNCRAPLSQKHGGKPRAFCSDECRIAWWKKHPEEINRKAYYSLTCAYCGKSFESYGHKERKYCSHACYIAERFGVP